MNGRQRMKIVLLGYGTVGAGVDELIGSDPRLNSSLEVSGIFSRTYKNEMRDPFLTSFDDVTGSDCDTVVELIGGLHPAYEYVKAALLSGKNAVTANKAVIAAYYPELSAIAREQGVSLLFSAAAGGGIPWLKNLSRAAETGKVLSLKGVMNGTTNYILDEMTERGGEYASALKEAQKLGYAEADPTSDVKGFDTRRKLAVSLFVGLGTFVDETSIPAFGIDEITPEDISYAGKEGAVIKLLGTASANEDGSVSAFVIPAFVSRSGIFASLHGSENAFSYTADALGTQCFTGAGAGRYPTAMNVVRDLYDLASSRTPFPPVVFREGLVKNYGRMRFYVREANEIRIETASIDEMRDAYEGKQGVFIALMP